jgi:hypothetical protein
MNEDKMKRLLEMQEHPERYSEEEIRQLMADEECRQLYEQMVKATDSMFAENHKSHALPKRPTALYKIAAVFIGLLMLSGIAYAAVRIVSNMESNPKVAITDRKPDVKKVKKSFGTKAAPTKQEPVKYNNVELQQIMQYIADGYGVKVEFKNEAARTLRFYLQWEADDTLQEIIDQINHFEKVHLTLTDEIITIE